MSEKVIEPGLSAATDECGRFNCNDEMDCCWHCGAHFSEPHAPDCKHADEPFDECDARPADPEEQADWTIWTASWGGTAERVGETAEDLKAYLNRSRAPQWYADKIVAWFAGGATPSPYTLPAWHGETESWWVGPLDEARS